MIADASALLIAIDGHAGSGKSSTAVALAKQLGYRHLNTGAMYRGLTAYFLDLDLQWQAPRARHLALERLTLDIVPQSLGFCFKWNGVVFDHQRLYASDVQAAVQAVSSYADVRAYMHPLQRALGKQKGLVAEGRDMGTEVFPEADIRIFFTADLAIRARRRHAELQLRMPRIRLADVQMELQRRDSQDEARKISPLRKAKGVRIIDTTQLTQAQQLAQLMQWVQDTKETLQPLGRTKEDVSKKNKK